MHRVLRTLNPEHAFAHKTQGRGNGFTVFQKYFNSLVSYRVSDCKSRGFSLVLGPLYDKGEFYICHITHLLSEGLYLKRVPWQDTSALHSIERPECLRPS